MTDYQAIARTRARVDPARRVGDASDSSENLVDRVYDTLERGAVMIGTVLGVDMRGDMPADRSPPAPRAVRAPFRIDEMIDGDTGKPVFVVTDGKQSCDCKDRAFAESVLDALASKGEQVARR